MNLPKKFFGVGLLSLSIAIGSVAIGGDTPKDKPGAGAPEMKLPAGWTQADMQACMEAGTPGDAHKQLAQHAGTWNGKCTMWMAPGTEPMKSECTATYTMIMDGRFLRCEMSGDFPGMGPFLGQGLYGYDNTSQKLQSSWITNCNTNILTGVGEQSSDGKTTTWLFSYTCPITKKPTMLREIETITGANTKTLESFGTDPKSGKEFKMMRIEFTKK